MAEVNAVNGVSGVASSGSSVADLSSVIAGTVLQQLDAQVASFTEEMVQVNNQKIGLTNEKNAVADMVGNSPSQDQINNTTLSAKDNLGHYDSAQYAELKEMAAKYGLSAKFETSCDSHFSDGYVIDRSIVDDIKGAIDNKLQNLNTTSEMKMTQFQALMDARKQMMLMLSNMLNSDTQTKMSIIQNMKG